MKEIGPFKICPILRRNNEITSDEIFYEVQKRIQFLKDNNVFRQKHLALKATPTLNTIYWMYACFLSGRIFFPLSPEMTDIEIESLKSSHSFIFVDESMPLPSRITHNENPTTDEEILVTLFSSGSEGIPKSISLTLSNFKNHSYAHARHNNQTSDDIWPASLSLFHIGGVCLFVRALLLGQKIIFDEKFTTEKFLYWLKDTRMTGLSLVPTMLYRLLQEKDFTFTPKLKIILIGGAPLSPELEAKAKGLGLPIATTYGMTETCSQVVTNNKLFPNVKILINPDSEILISTPALSPTVIRDQNGFYSTGDLGMFDNLGNLHILGRKKNLINSGGEKFSPEEIESVLLTHPCIQEAAVWGTPDPEWGEIICAAYVPSPESTIKADELTNFLRLKLPSKKIPKFFIKLKSLPKTANNKLKRSELKSLLLKA